MWFAFVCCTRDSGCWCRHGSGRSYLDKSLKTIIVHSFIKSDVKFRSQYTPAVDMWSVGVILYILLSVRAVVSLLRVISPDTVMNTPAISSFIPHRREILHLITRMSKCYSKRSALLTIL